jgi:hypothetical protein
VSNEQARARRQEVQTIGCGKAMQSMDKIQLISEILLGVGRDQ